MNPSRHLFEERSASRARRVCLAALLCLGGADVALAQGHGTPNAPEAGPAEPGTESRTGQGAVSPERDGVHRPHDETGKPDEDRDRAGHEPRR